MESHQIKTERLREENVSHYHVEEGYRLSKASESVPAINFSTDFRDLHFEHFEHLEVKTDCLSLQQLLCTLPNPVYLSCTWEN